MEERRDLLDQLNGVYLPGDSHNTVTDEAYKAAFIQTLSYVEDAAYEDKEHFPMFLMGNALQTLVRARQSTGNNLSNMTDLRFSNSRVDMLGNPNDYYFLNGLEREDKQALFNTAQFFNMQVSGVKPKDVESDKQLSKLIKPMATFSSHNIESESEQFIAMAEGIKLPLYAFTYAIEMV